MIGLSVRKELKVDDDIDVQRAGMWRNIGPAELGRESRRQPANQKDRISLWAQAMEERQQHPLAVDVQ